MTITRKVTKSESSDGRYILSQVTGTSASTTILSSGVHTPRAAGADSITRERAVYAHIQALRALGRTTVNTAEIARALNLSVREVDGTIAALRQKGVKIA